MDWTDTAIERQQHTGDGAAVEAVADVADELADDGADDDEQERWAAEQERWAAEQERACGSEAEQEQRDRVTRTAVQRSSDTQNTKQWCVCV